MALLDVKNLTTRFHTRNGIIRAVDDVSFDVDSGETITETNSGGTADVVAIVTSTDFALMSAASFDEIEQIRFAGNSQIGTFTGAQLTGETLALHETVAGTSSLIINVASGTTANFSNITAHSSFTNGTDTVTINGVGGAENITGPNLVTSINGGVGDDIIIAGSDIDTIDGGDGADELFLSGRDPGTTTE